MPNDLLSVWPHVRDFIQRGLDEGSDYTIQEIFDGLIDRDMQLWVYEPDTIRAAMVTTLQNKNGRRWCLLLVVGGSHMGEWSEYLPFMEEWARSNGCDEMRVYGRRGWSKVLGYDVDWSRMSKKL